MKLLHIAVSYEQKIMTMIAGSTAPDVMWINHPDVAAFVERQTLLDLTSFLKEEPNFNLNDFYPVAVTLASYKKGIYIILKDICPLVIYYNKTIFDKEGIPYPDNTWSWDDFLDAAKRLTKDFDGDGRIGQFGFNGDLSYYGIISWLHQAGGNMFNQDMTKCQEIDEILKDGF